MRAMGLDFGTTNSVLAAADGAGDANARVFRHAGADFEAFRTTLAFQRLGRSDLKTEAGPWAIDAFIDAPEETRFLQSFKSFAASKAFSETSIFLRRFRFEDLLSAFVNRMRERAGLEQLPETLVVGRPVTFAGGNPDDALARQRYDAAFASLGVKIVHYVLEPVAAAYYYAQRLTREAVILVGDFGGGTSDFSIIRFRPGEEPEALGSSGVGIAGDAFDYRIIDAIVSPRLGKNSSYVSWGKKITIPVHYYVNFSRWNELCLMNRPDVLRELRAFARDSEVPEKIEAFIDLIEGGASYELYRAVSAAKAELSSREEARFRFRSPGLAIDTTFSRGDFEGWIGEDLARIEAAVGTVLSQTDLAERSVDRVFLTGGTSYVPAVRALFKARFGAEKIETGDELISIAKGLALIAASPEPGRWAAASVNSF